MQGKARFIFPVLMAGQMVFMVTALITFINLGFPPDYFSQWMRAFFISWPVAATASFAAIPVARWATGHIIAVIGE